MAPDEVNVNCEDTGLVVYCTPSYAWGGHHSAWAAETRAKRWLARHGFTLNLVDHGNWTRATSSIIQDPGAIVRAFKEALC